MFATALCIFAALCCNLVSADLTCVPESQPNPIKGAGGTNPTGTINGTLAVLPIPLSEAQRIVGPNYTIQTAAYRSLLPTTFPTDMYPAIIQAVLDHDIEALGIGIPDFTRISIEYPFLSIPGTNTSTSFRQAPIQAMTALNSIALSGSAAYGTHVLPATFGPSCDAYAHDPASGATSLNASRAITGSALFTTAFQPASDSVYPLAFFENVTNQPSFADPSKGCDRQVRRFDTAVTRAPWEPVEVQGDVWASGAVYDGDLDVDSDGKSRGRMWKGVWGVRLDTSFIEYNLLKCDTL